MSLHYVPKPIKRLMFLKMEWMNKFFNWWMDYRKISVLTLAMIVAIIWLVNQA
jgi:hypothetical protein